MKWQDLPESNNVADRRGKKEPKTFHEKLEAGLSEPQPDMTPNPDTDPELPNALGVNDIPRSDPKR